MTQPTYLKIMEIMEFNWDVKGHQSLGGKQELNWKQLIALPGKNQLISYL